MIIKNEFNHEVLEKLKKVDVNINDYYIDSVYRNIKIYIIDDKIIGYIIYDLLIDKIEIVNIFVKEEYRRNNYAYYLLNNIILLAKNSKYQNISLEVSINNQAALNLYQKLGFQKVALRKQYYADKSDAFLMLLKIDTRDILILAIESSCDETSVSIIKNGVEELATSTASQIDIHKKFGGVVPEIASREHVKNITLTLEEALEKAKVKIESVDAIAVTIGPGLVGALLVGIEAAKTLSLIYNKPLIGVNHMMGHIYGNNLAGKIIYPALCLTVSGGHTELIYVDDPYNFYKLGETLDDAVGECYDKVARILELDYPGGPKIDKLAQSGHHSYDLPIPLNDESLNFSYSGLKSAVINLVNKEKQKGNIIIKENLARSFQDIIVESLINKTSLALNRYPVKTLMLAGGVSANSDIRKAFEVLANQKNLNFSCPPLNYCTDNAAMIGAYAYFMYNNNEFLNLEFNAKPALNIF